MNEHDEIMRLINNSFYDGEHPLRSGRSGMKDFAKLAFLITNCSNNNLGIYLARLDELFQKVEDCNSCSAKLSAFLYLYCRGRRGFEEVAGGYLEKHREIQAGATLRGSERNYMDEVLKEIEEQV